MVSHHIHSLWQMSNSAVQWPPTLFIMMFSPLMRDVLCDSDIGIAFRYQFGGKLFKLWRLQVKTKVRLMSSITFSLQMTVHIMMAPSPKCGRVLICSLLYKEHKEDLCHLPTYSCCTLHRAYCQSRW